MPRGAPGAETFLSELDSEDSRLFGEPLGGMGAPTPCRGALPERRLSFLGLSSKGSLRFVVQLEVAVVQNQREENVYELIVDIVEDDPVGLALGFHA